MKKFENFCNALDNLQDINLYEEPYENVIMTGMVSLFEFCFEQAWKAMKEILEDHGYAEGQTGSPRMIVKVAYKAGMIRDEQIWLEALISRNNVAHAYNKDIALDIIKKSKATYLQMFIELKEELKENWVSD